MTDDTNDTTDTFTAGSAPDRLADVLEGYAGAENAEDDPEATCGRLGTGKTGRHAEVMATVSDHDETKTEWIDPKGEGREEW